MQSQISAVLKDAFVNDQDISLDHIAKQVGGTVAPTNTLVVGGDKFQMVRLFWRDMGNQHSGKGQWDFKDTYNEEELKDIFQRVPQ